MKLKQINIFPVMIFFTFLVFSSCDNNNVTNPNVACGGTQELLKVFLSGQYTNTYLDASNFRVFQYNTLNGTTIENICTYEEPPASATADLNDDPTDPILIAIEVLTGPTVPYTSFGTKVHVSGDHYTWSGSVPVGLQQEYGNGPGRVLSLQVEISFPTRGTFPQDSVFLSQSNFFTTVKFDYHDHLTK